MFVYKLKNYISAMVALALVVCFCLGLRLGNVCKLSAIPGKRTFYLDYASSQALRSTALQFQDALRVKGESVRFVIDETTEPETLALALAEKYDAEILFTEEAGGTVSFYCYAPALYTGVCVRGKTVNLHIAVSGTACAVGSPIVFDGF